MAGDFHLYGKVGSDMFSWKQDLSFNLALVSLAQTWQRGAVGST